MSIHQPEMMALEERRQLYRDLREQAIRMDQRRLQRVRQLLARDADALGAGARDRAPAGRRAPAGHRRGRG